LGRFSHRLKTHGDWTVRRLADGASEWVSPHGFTFWVDHSGTHPHRTHPANLWHWPSPNQATTDNHTDHTGSDHSPDSDDSPDTDDTAV
ncbi:MAG: hypothetical protein QOH50_3579, partial [Kribbellaceae bacterium]|nr:hypothetical protein [Kribbellaceae bacterium]